MSGLQAEVAGGTLNHVDKNKTEQENMQILPEVGMQTDGATPALRYVAEAVDASLSKIPSVNNTSSLGPHETTTTTTSMLQ